MGSLRGLVGEEVNRIYMCVEVRERGGRNGMGKIFGKEGCEYDKKVHIVHARGLGR